MPIVKKICIFAFRPQKHKSFSSKDDIKTVHFKHFIYNTFFKITQFWKHLFVIKVLNGDSLKFVYRYSQAYA